MPLLPTVTLTCRLAPLKPTCRMAPRLTGRHRIRLDKEYTSQLPLMGSRSSAKPGAQCALPLYERADSNRVGDPSSLEQTRQRLEKILREEVALLGGRSELVFLGGLSQGCTAALDIYLQLASKLRLGGFVGSVGFLPRDAMGFGNDERIEALLQDEAPGECNVSDRSGSNAPRNLRKPWPIEAWSNGKRKFKAQDPVYRGLDVRQQMAHHSKKERCRAPKGDKDANDIPPIFGSMFGGGKDILATSAPSTGAAGPAHAPKSKKARRRERAKEAEANLDRPAKRQNLGGAFDISQAALPKEVSADATPLPKQRPLETVAEYSRRLQQAVKSKLQVVQKKANTDHQKERQKERARALKDKRRAKASKVSTPAAPSTAPKFGEVVQRPPSFSKDDVAKPAKRSIDLGPFARRVRQRRALQWEDTLKSLSKGQAVKSSAANLSDYASQVRNAYEEMKKKRREKAEAAQLAGKKSFADVMDRWPGLQLRTVRGRVPVPAAKVRTAALIRFGSNARVNFFALLQTNGKVIYFMSSCKNMPKTHITCNPEKKNYANDAVRVQKRGSTGRFEVTLPQDSPVSALAQEAARLTAVEPGRQRLICRGKVLSDATLKLETLLSKAGGELQVMLLPMESTSNQAKRNWLHYQRLIHSWLLSIWALIYSFFHSLLVPKAYAKGKHQEHHSDGIDPSDLARLAACGAGG
ncbi:unnamed protein product [Cladocopium goreaui]|uniref:Acyl-protein thioesterase 1 n=1 Tax=Cladocopium goreaui TaxID=2562237 RepID=A0A9P1BPC5_9DINO|nr:unnamed protein product [Cladocopium goreaui]